jgi:hypothetical protein
MQSPSRDTNSCPGTGMGDCGNPITATGFCARCTRFLDRVFVAAMTQWVACDKYPSHQPNP